MIKELPPKLGDKQPRKYMMSIVERWRASTLYSGFAVTNGRQMLLPWLSILSGTGLMTGR